MNISNHNTQINGDIRDREVRVISATGEQLGIMSAREANRLAEEQNLDLVKVAPQAKPPVCKIMDYGKYRFEQTKREKEAKKNQHIIEIKEVRLSLKIDKHDFETKVKQATKFLKAGDKVKVSIRFRGREMAHPKNGYEIMDKFAEAVSEYGNVEKKAKLEGRQMLMFLSAKNAKPPKKAGKQNKPKQPKADAPAAKAEAPAGGKE
ncbi:MAG: translation initiation factor IF-3 [Clostridia bacterium]|nr:translation initiation factor IF-3 [Clostridia bacterium]